MIKPNFIIFFVILLMVVLLTGCVIAVVTVMRRKEKRKIQNSLEQNRQISVKREICISNERYKTIEAAIERTLENPKSFKVYYQPIYSIKENKVVAAEALLRLFDVELGEIPTEEFVYVAEKNGKIIELGQNVLRQVCEFLQRQTKESFEIRYIQINLSIFESLREELPYEMEEILAEYGIEPEKINLEIKESALKKKDNVLTRNMEKLLEKGVHFSLDDYGTGASALTYIINFPFQIVKIDRDVLWNAMEDEHAMMALCASINMIKDMNMKIVVEGVESQEVAERLKKMGCDFLQGYYFSKPMPEEEFLDYLKQKLIMNEKI